MTTLPLRSLFDGSSARRDSDEEEVDEHQEAVDLAWDGVRDPPAPQGHIHLICGPMFAGKSTELLRRVRRWSVMHKNIVVFTHEKDVLFGEDMIITTHDVMVEHKAASFEVHAVSDLSGPRATMAAARASVIAVDEGQFFTDLAPTCNKWADEGRVVVVAALDTTYERKPFDTMVGLCPDFITKLTAVCMCCGDEAPFTHRTSDETELEVVGGNDKYEALCRVCYNRTDAPKSGPEI